MSNPTAFFIVLPVRCAEYSPPCMAWGGSFSATKRLLTIRKRFAQLGVGGLRSRPERHGDFSEGFL